jgi:hypothetical protein
MGGGVLSRVYRGGLVRLASVPGCAGQAAFSAGYWADMVLDLVQLSPAASHVMQARKVGEPRPRTNQPALTEPRADALNDGGKESRDRLEHWPEIPCCAGLTDTRAIARPTPPDAASTPGTW